MLYVSYELLSSIKRGKIAKFTVPGIGILKHLQDTRCNGQAIYIGFKLAATQPFVKLDFVLCLVSNTVSFSNFFSYN